MTNGHANCCELFPYIGIRAYNRPILEPFGVWKDDYNDFQILLLAGLVMGDPVVTFHSQQEGCFTYCEDPFEDFDDEVEPLPEGAPRNKQAHSAAVDVHFDKIAERMGEAGCAELRERIKKNSGTRMKR